MAPPSKRPRGTSAASSVAAPPKQAVAAPPKQAAVAPPRPRSSVLPVLPPRATTIVGAAPGADGRRAFSRRLQDYADSLDVHEGSLFATATSEPFDLFDLVAEELDAWNDDGDGDHGGRGNAFETDSCEFLSERPLRDSEFAVSKEDFAPLVDAMRNVEREAEVLAKKFAKRLISNVLIQEELDNSEDDEGGDDDE